MRVHEYRNDLLRYCRKLTGVPLRPSHSLLGGLLLRPRRLFAVKRPFGGRLVAKRLTQWYNKSMKKFAKPLPRRRLSK